MLQGYFRYLPVFAVTVPLGSFTPLEVLVLVLVAEDDLFLAPAGDSTIYASN
jgi:hypothetical protein